MSAPRVKVSVEHLRADITRYLEAEAGEQAVTIADAVSAAVAAFDFDAAIEQVCVSELNKFVREAAATYFRALLKSDYAYHTILATLKSQMETS